MRIARAGSLLALILSIASPGFANQEDEPAEACPSYVTDWLIENAIEFNTTDPAAPLDDLDFLRGVVGDAQIVAMGEQTHGTKEFFEMKHRIFRFLVEEMGFRTLAFEAPLCGLLELNECLLPDGPPIETSFHQLRYITWFSDEVMTLLKWMRTYNESHEDDPVRLVGLEFMSTVVECVGVSDGLQGAGASVGIRSKSWLAGSPRLSQTQVLRQIASVDRYAGHTVRDRFMAANVGWWLDELGEDTRIAIWAHNAHIARGLNEDLTWIMMGLNLKEAYGDRYLPIGFSFAQGAFTSFPRKPLEVTAEPLIPECYEGAFQTTAYPRYVVDLRTLVPGSEAHAWMSVERPFRAIGGEEYYPPDHLGWGFPAVLPESFDVIIHIETSTPTVPLWEYL